MRLMHAKSFTHSLAWMKININLGQLHFTNEPKGSFKKYANCKMIFLTLPPLLSFNKTRQTVA